MDRWRQMAQARSTVLLAAVIALLVAACDDKITTVVLRNEDDEFYFFQTIERGAARGTEAVLSPESIGLWQVPEGWRGTARLVERRSCDVIDELDVAGPDLLVVVRSGGFEVMTTVPNRDRNAARALQTMDPARCL